MLKYPCLSKVCLLSSQNFSGRDRDRDGFVDNSRFYALASKGKGSLFLRHWKGRRYSDNSWRWQPLSLSRMRWISSSRSGKQDRSELFRILDVNGSGRINRLNRWQLQQLALSKDWENILVMASKSMVSSKTRIRMLTDFLMQVLTTG